MASTHLVKRRVADDDTPDSDPGVAGHSDAQPQSPSHKRRSFHGTQWLRVAGAAVASVLLWIVYLRVFSDAQGTMLQVMQCHARVLDELNIPYFLDAGTLLGCVREGGFLFPDERDDIDIAIKFSDVPKLVANRHLAYERCGHWIVHRSDYQYLPSFLPFIPRQSAFRILKNRLTPWYYVDILDLEDIGDGKVQCTHNKAGRAPELQVDKVLPVAPCKCLFEGLQFKCPADSEYVLEQWYGKDWRVPKRNFRHQDIIHDGSGEAAGHQATSTALRSGRGVSR